MMQKTRYDSSFLQLQIILIAVKLLILLPTIHTGHNYSQTQNCSEKKRARLSLGWETKATENRDIEESIFT